MELFLSSQKFGRRSVFERGDGGYSIIKAQADVNV